MYWHIYFMVFILVCLQLVSSQVSISYTYVEKKCTKEIVLICTYTGATNCCSASTRLWFKNDTQILNDGVSTPAGKYSEREADGNQFKLVINNLVETDLDQDYQCSYALTTSPAYNLKENSQYLKLCPICVKCGLECVGWGVLGIVIAFLQCIIVCYLYCAYMGVNRGKVFKAAAISLAVFLVIDLSTALPIGFYLCICYEFSDPIYDPVDNAGPFFILIGISAMFALFILLVLRCKEDKIDEYHAWIFFGVITYGIGLIIYRFSRGKEKKPAPV